VNDLISGLWFSLAGANNPPGITNQERPPLCGFFHFELFRDEKNQGVAAQMIHAIRTIL